nr:aldo/keto reductase [Enterococcus sp. CU12B]
MHAYQFQKANHVAEKNGWTKFVSMQNHLNLIYREEEREMIPYCVDQGIALTPYSPLASGRLVKSLNDTSLRRETDTVQKDKYDESEEKDRIIIERVAEVAEQYGVSKVEVALAWLLQKENLAAPIIGATKLSHVETAVKAIDFKLTPETVNYLEAEYVPHKIVGFS